MGFVFYNCVNLVNAPTIGTNITNMYYAFQNCINLIGYINVLSPNVTVMANCFLGCNASRAKTLRVPAESTTYTTAMAACNGKNGVTVEAY